MTGKSRAVSVFVALLGVFAGLRAWGWSGTSAPAGVEIYSGPLSELVAKIEAKSHYLKSKMAGTAFDGGVAQSSDFWKANGDGTYTVQIQCVYKNDLRFVNLSVYEAGNVVRATQVDQNWCSGSAKAFSGFVEDSQVSHTGTWKPGAGHYYACSLEVADMADCEAAIGDVKYKTLNEAKKVAVAAAVGSEEKIVTLLRDKILWTSAYIENFTLVIPENVTFTLANDDVANSSDPTAKLYVKGTLHVNEGCHITVGRNVLELYAGGTIDGIGDNYGLLFVTNEKAIPVRASGGHDTFTIDGDVRSNVDIIFDIDSGVKLSITGGVNPTGTGHGVESIGGGTLEVLGTIGGRYTVSPTKPLDVGTIPFGTDYSVESFGGAITNSDAVNDRSGRWPQMNSLTMRGDTVASGYSFGFVRSDYSPTVLDLGGNTFTVALRADDDDWKTRNFYLANTSIKNGGEFLVERGEIVLYQAGSEMKTGVMRLKAGTLLNLNGCTLTVNDLVNEGGTISTRGELMVNGVLSGANTVGNLTMADNATIRLSGDETLTVTKSFTVNGRLNVDLTDYLNVGAAGAHSFTIAERPDPLIVLPAGTSEAATQEVINNIIFTAPTIRGGCALVADGNVIKLKATPMTLYWNAWRGTFWEHIGQFDANGNHGYARDAGGDRQAILTGDTIVFDRDHYTKDGVFAEQNDFWHSDENLYIKNEVQPGADNEWDLMILQGVKLKMGLRGPRTSGQNVISAFKIYVEEGSELEFGYWGNTHHYQGVLRDGVCFGGGGTISLGDDLGPGLRAEGDVRVKGELTPTLTLRGKELELWGKTNGAETDVSVNLNGFGSVTARDPNVHLTGDVDFGDAATIDAKNAANLLTCDRGVTFGSKLSVALATAPTKESPVKVLRLGPTANLQMDTTDVRVVVGGVPVAAFYELYQDEEGDLSVRLKEQKVVYGVQVNEGYDFAGSLVTVTMSPAIEGLPVRVQVGDRTWTGNVGAAGTGIVMVGDEDNLISAGNYDYRVEVADQTISGSLFVGNRWFAANPTAGETGGAWVTRPAVSDGRYVLSETSTFTIAADKAASELGVVEQTVDFPDVADDEELEAAKADLADVKGVLTLATQADGETLCWKGLVGGTWVEMSGAAATIGEHFLRTEFDRTGPFARMRFLVDGAALSAESNGTDAEGWFAVSADPLVSLSYQGQGFLSNLEGLVDQPALVQYDGVKYMTMEAAVAAWRENGETGAIRLLTNVYFAPEPGVYRIDRNGFALYLTNDMVILSDSDGLITVGFPKTVEGYTAGSADFPIVIRGEWLGHAIPWRRRRLVQESLLERPDGSAFTRWQAYVLGFDVGEAETAQSNLHLNQTSETDKIYLSDGLEALESKETGVVVRRVLREGTFADALTDAAVQPDYTEMGLPVDLATMDRVKFAKIGYEFLPDEEVDANPEEEHQP